MINTTTINYALGKISEGWQKAAPTLQNVSEKYVRFQVTKAVLFPIPFLIAAAIFFFLSKRLWKKKRESGYLSDWEIPAGLCSVAWVVCLIAFGFGVYDAALAISNPEMYTIQSVIDAASHK